MAKRTLKYVALATVAAVAAGPPGLAVYAAIVGWDRASRAIRMRCWYVDQMMTINSLFQGMYVHRARRT